VSRPSAALEVGAFDVDDLLGVAGHVDEALVVRHGSDHVDVTHLRIFVGLVVVDFDLDRFLESTFKNFEAFVAEIS